MAEDELVVPSDFNLLIVDDILSNVLLLEAILKKEGYRTRHFTDPVEALSYIESELPDLVLLDVMMPGLNGFEVLEIMKKNPATRHIAAIFLTALNDSASIVKGFQLGAVDFITKPFRKEELLVRIQNQLRLLAAHRTILTQKENLESTIRSRDMLYSIISHDLRSPIGTTKMLCETLDLLVDKGALSSEATEVIDLITKTSTDAYELLDNLLKWTKTQLGKMSVEKRITNLEELVDVVISGVQSQAMMKKIEIRSLCAENLPEVLIDTEMIKTVLRNLFSNAIKFSDPSGVITVNGEFSETEVTLSVADQGRGIAPENADKVFGEKGTFTTYGTLKEKGSGIGLQLCKQLVEASGGQIWFTSEPGKGTTFFFTVPLNE